MSTTYTNSLDAASSHGERNEQLLTPRQVATLLQVSYGWVKDHATRKQPHLKCVRLGSLLRFRAKDIEEFIEQWCH